MKIKRYIVGFLIGLIFEYLMRVNFNIYALIILIALCLYIILDLTLNFDS